MNPFRFRGYQHAHIAELSAPENQYYRLLAIIYGVGGGKTATALAFASLQLDVLPALGIIVAVPQTAIGAQFAELAGGEFEFDGKLHRFPYSHTRSCATGNELRSYLSTAGNRDRRMVITHSSTILNCEHDLRVALSEGRPMLFIVDEGHHSPEIEEGESNAKEQQFAQLMSKLWREFPNVRILKLTGTPYRSDNRKVLDDEALICSKRLVELMQEGYAPVTVLTDDVTLPPEIDGAVARIVKKWMDDGRPSVVIRVKHTMDVVAPLVAAFEEQGASVYDTTGPDGAKRLLEGITLDREGRLERGAVFVAKGRMIEGVNVKTLTHAYFWGIPQSMTILEQLLGRVMRMRFIGDRLDLSKPIEPIPNVLLEWAIRSKVTFFFGDAADGTGGDHARLLLRAILFLSTFVNPSWLTRQLLGIKDGIPVYRGKSDPVELLDQRRLALAMEVIDRYEDLEWKPRVHPLSSIQLLTQPSAFGTPICEWYKEHPALRLEGDPMLELGDFLEALNYRRKVFEARQLGKLRKSVKALDDGLMQDVLDDLILAFHEDTYEDDHYALRSENMEYWAERVNRELLERIEGQPKTEDEILERVVRFHARTGKWPQLADEDETPRKPVPFRRYHEMVKRMSYPGLTEFICVKQEKDLGATVRDLLALGSDTEIQEMSQKQAFDLLRGKGVVGYYYAKEILAGGFCGIAYPQGMDPLEVLGVLGTLNKSHSRRKLEVIKAVYHSEGLDGVRAHLRDDTDEQTTLAPTELGFH